MERNLIQEERIAKAEAEAENVRAERLIVIEQMNKVKTQLQEAQFAVAQMQMELKQAKESLIQKETSIKELQELNNQIKALILERNDLREQLSQEKSNPTGHAETT